MFSHFAFYDYAEMQDSSSEVAIKADTVRRYYSVVGNRNIG